MKKKIISILVCGLLIATSLVILSPNQNTVQAEETEESGSDLDLEYLWSQIDVVADIIRSSYEPGDIRKGRFMGSKGGNDTCNNIIKKQMNNMGLSNVRTDKIEKIGTTEIYYNRLLDVVGYNLSLNSISYPYSNDIPKSEFFPTVCTDKVEGGYDYAMEFEDAEILHQNLRLKQWHNWFDFSYEISEYDTYNEDYNELIGKLEYLTEQSQTPVNQSNRVYLFDWDDYSQDFLDNLTSANGVILIDIGEDNNLNFSNNSFQVKKINESEGNELIDILNNYSDVMIDSVSNNITANYEFNDSFLPSIDYVIIDRIPNHTELANDHDSDLLNSYWTGYPTTPTLLDYFTCAFIWSVVFKVINILSIPVNCVSFVLYSSFDHYIMPPTHILWDEEDDGVDYMGSPVIPVRPLLFICVNESLGEFLNDTRDETTIDGDIHQDYFAGTEENPGVDAYNAIGELNIEESPNDEYIIISNRYDGMWGETPGDSGIGTAMVLSIARYQKDLQENHSVDPKYNITYLFTTGEEMGFRGAYYHRDNLSEEDRNNIKMWIGTDQLGQNQNDLVLAPECRSPNAGSNAWINRDIIWAMANTTNYEDRSGYDFEPSVQTTTGGSEDAVWGESVCDTIVFVKDNARAWDRWHATGENYDNGDSLKYTDKNDVNLTYDLFWYFVKYKCYNPDSWFTNVSYEALDSQDDGDTLPDSIKVNFTINSIMPEDLNMVKLHYNKYDNPEGAEVYSTNDYAISSNSRTEELIFSIPDNYSDGEFSIHLKLYNSTGRINDIISLGINNHNDTSSGSDVYKLYHPFGYTKVGSNYLLGSLNNYITGSVFTAHEYGVADNVTAYIRTTIAPDPHCKCMIYRNNDSTLIGTTQEINETFGNGAWGVFNFSDPKPVLVKDTEYVLVSWSSSPFAKLYYNTWEDERGRRDIETYGDSPNPANFTNVTRLYSIYCSYTADTISPEITNVSDSPDTVGFGHNITVYADVSDNQSGLDTVKVNITYPDDSYSNFTMIGKTTAGTLKGHYSFNDTWQVGQYNYTIWAEDLSIDGNLNSSSGHSFNVSAQANITVCTIQNTYGASEDINITDPPTPNIGYDLLDIGDVLHIWNQYDSYYFDTDSGIQLTNHHDEYWTHNVLMLGYYNNDQWNLIYRTDNLSGFNNDVETDDETFVNATLWKDLSYGGYDFRLAIRYLLGVDDTELTVIPYIKNIDDEAIPYTLGFGWELKDIQIDMTETGDYIEVGNESYLLNQSLDLSYSNLSDPIYWWNVTTNMTEICGYSDPAFHIMENVTDTTTESLYLRWDKNLNYKLRVKSRTGQYNAPVTLFIKIGTLDADQEKYTSMFWYDASQLTCYFNDYDSGEAWSTNPSYMVDGSTSTFATTSITGDVERFEGNSYADGGNGTISKVEIRGHGEAPEQSAVWFRPVFGGSLDGDNHIVCWPSRADWCSWIDITSDSNAPSSWLWSDVSGLECDVETVEGVGTF
jgi:hypothetical protein